jgi:hypothetical protein
MRVNSTLAAANTTFRLTNVAVETQQNLIKPQAAALQKTNDTIASLNTTVANSARQSAGMPQQIASWIAEKTVMPPVIPNCRKPKYLPPICTGTKPNPEYQKLEGQIRDTQKKLNELNNQGNQAQRDLENDRKDLTTETTSLASLNKHLKGLQKTSAEAQAYRDTARDALEGAQAVLQNIVPGVPLQCNP